jgi:hypothetical protein
MNFPAPSEADLAAVRALLGREPAGEFRVVVRRTSGSPVVIENAPHLGDGTPMPTLYWLVDPSLREQVSRVESHGGVRRLEAALPAEGIQAAHDAYASRREALVERRDLPQPSGGVGGTRAGLKCLHAHLASFLAGIDDVAGSAIAAEIELGDLVPTPSTPVGVEESLT